MTQPKQLECPEAALSRAFVTRYQELLLEHPPGERESKRQHHALSSALAEVLSVAAAVVAGDRISEGLIRDPALVLQDAIFDAHGKMAEVVPDILSEFEFGRDTGQNAIAHAMAQNTSIVLRELDVDKGESSKGQYGAALLITLAECIWNVHFAMDHAGIVFPEAGADEDRLGAVVKLALDRALSDIRREREPSGLPH